MGIWVGIRERSIGVQYRTSASELMAVFLAAPEAGDSR